MVRKIFDLRLEVGNAVVRHVFDLLNSAVFTELVRLIEVMAVLFPVMLCQLIESSVGFRVLAAIKLALVLVLLVMFIHVLQKFIIAHLLFAFGNFRTCRSIAFEPREEQVHSIRLDFFFIFICGLKLFSTGHAGFFVIFIKDSSAGAANWIETFTAVLWIKDHVHAGAAFEHLIIYLCIWKRSRNLRL